MHYLCQEKPLGYKHHANHCQCNKFPSDDTRIHTPLLIITITIITIMHHHHHASSSSSSSSSSPSCIIIIIIMHHHHHASSSSSCIKKMSIAVCTQTYMTARMHWKCHKLPTLNTFKFCCGRLKCWWTVIFVVFSAIPSPPPCMSCSKSKHTIIH